MSKSSAFARVIGLTKSLSPLGFERDKAVSSDHATDDIVAAAVADSEAFARTAAMAEAQRAIAAEAVLSEVSLPAGNVTQVLPLDEVDAESVRNAVAADAILTIEADIAKLLASLDTVQDDATDADEEQPDDEGEPTLALLSELNRLWMADHTASVAA